MPNWCSDRITITGPEADLAAFRSVLEDHYNEAEHDGSYSLINAFVPAPDDLGDDWWEWTHQNWGTKWPDAMHMVYSDPTEITLTGMTAWSPPVEAIEQISAMYPTLTFVMDWDEPGMQFLGAACIQAGKTVACEVNHKNYPQLGTNDEGEWDDDAWADWLDQVQAKIEACRKVVMP